MLNIAIVSHGFRGMCESHKQDGETLSAQHDCCRVCQRLAILPWPSDLPLIWTANGRPANRQRGCPTCERTHHALRHQRAGPPARKPFIGEYPTVRSTLCNALRPYAEDSRESGAA